MITLCLGDERDRQMQHIASMLHSLNTDVIVMNTAKLTQQIHVQWQPDTESHAVTIDNECFELDDVGAFLWQRFFPPSAANPTDSQNNISALSPLFYHQPMRWYNPLSAIRFHQAKPVQLHTAQSLGAAIPATLISNNPQRLKSFAAQHQNVIVKPVSGGTHTKFIRQNGKFTSDALEQPNPGPVTLQGWIDGHDVRTFVIDGTVYSGAIYSDKPDYRTDDYASAQAYDIPGDIRALSQTICLAFGMKWCAIDWRRNTKGEFVFLEANPCPQFLKFEHDTQHPISERLCRALIATASH